MRSIPSQQQRIAATANSYIINVTGFEKRGFIVICIQFRKSYNVDKSVHFTKVQKLWLITGGVAFLKNWMQA